MMKRVPTTDFADFLRLFQYDETFSPQNTRKRRKLLVRWNIFTTNITKSTNEDQCDEAISKVKNTKDQYDETSSHHRFRWSSHSISFDSLSGIRLV